MVRDIMKNPMFLALKSEPATEADKQVAQDLLDTLQAHRESCVGMAANMIGVRKNIIAVTIGFFNIAMINPVIVKKSGQFMTQEGCLSLEGIRPCTRYRDIEVEYLDMEFRPQQKKYTGQVAQIIQHEVDHTVGIII